MLRVGLKDVLADRGYTATANGSGFIMPVRALGGEPVFELYENQRGAHGTAHGAIIIDGQPFSPSCPPTLFDIPKPPVSASTADIVAYQNAIAVRAQYALVPYGSRKKNGAQNFRCPARCKKLSCPLVATSKKSAFPVFTNPKIAAPNSVCSQQYKLFAAADIPLSQREMFGSKAWYDSNNRRSRVEGFFGNIKNEACENLRHGTIRVMGLAKTGFMIAFAVAATNLRLIRSFLASGKAAVRAKKGRGRPRKPGVQVFLPAGVTLAAPNAPPGR